MVIEFVRRYIRESRPGSCRAKDLEQINAAADEMNPEVEDVLRYQSLDDLAANE